MVTAKTRHDRLGMFKPIPVLAGWLVLVSAWGLLGAELNVNGPPHPITSTEAVFGGLFLAILLAAAPIGFARRSHRLLDLLVWAAIVTGALEFWYVVMMVASSDPTSDDTAAVGMLLTVVPVWALLLLLLLVGWGIGRLALRRRKQP